MSAGFALITPQLPQVAVLNPGLPAGYWLTSKYDSLTASYYTDWAPVYTPQTQPPPPATQNLVAISTSTPFLVNWSKLSGLSGGQIGVGAVSVPNNVLPGTNTTGQSLVSINGVVTWRMYNNGRQLSQPKSVTTSVQQSTVYNNALPPTYTTFAALAVPNVSQGNTYVSAMIVVQPNNNINGTNGPTNGPILLGVGVVPVSGPQKFLAWHQTNFFPDGASNYGTMSVSIPMIPVPTTATGTLVTLWTTSQNDNHATFNPLTVAGYVTLVTV